MLILFYIYLSMQFMILFAKKKKFYEGVACCKLFPLLRDNYVPLCGRNFGLTSGVCRWGPGYCHKTVRSYAKIAANHFWNDRNNNGIGLFSLSRGCSLSPTFYSSFRFVRNGDRIIFSKLYRCFGTSSLNYNRPSMGQDPFSNEDKDNKDDGDKNSNWNRFLSGLLLFSIAITLVLAKDLLFPSNRDVEEENELRVSWSEFLHEMLERGEVREIVVKPELETAFIRLHDGAIFRGQIAPNTTYLLRIPNVARFEEQIRKTEREIGIPPSGGIPVIYQRTNVGAWVGLILFVALNLVLFHFVRSAQARFGVQTFGSVFDGLRKARYRLVDPHGAQSSPAPKIKFKDVAGLHEAKVEIAEFVDYLKRPETYTRLGAKLPKGALLLGPPGCGKTLLAKAVASEAIVPFLAVNGTEFIEMIGGLGASRVRDLFKEGKKRAPCIIYIDEIDAIGRKRSGEMTGLGGGSGEEEQTLNQLLVELDGMSSDRGVIVLASTNRSDILDKALLRRGRFDRHILIDLPTASERKEIFDLYLSALKLEKPADTYSGTLSQMTPGFSGADIFNVCNEAAIHAATNQKKMVGFKSLNAAIERVVAGSQKRSTTLSPAEREIVAYHESGHALVGWLLKHTDALLKISIIPRTNALLGLTQYSPADRRLYSKEQLFDRMCMTLGGRAAENVVFGRVTTGAEDDLKKVTKIAYDQVKVYGMNDSVGPLSFAPSPDQEREEQFIRKPYSKRLQARIDQEASSLVAKAYFATEKLLSQNINKLEKLSRNVLEKEVLTYDEVKELIGPPSYGEKEKVESVEQELPSPSATDEQSSSPPPSPSSSNVQEEED